MEIIAAVDFDGTAKRRERHTQRQTYKEREKQAQKDTDGQREPNINRDWDGRYHLTLLPTVSKKSYFRQQVGKANSARTDETIVYGLL